MVPQFNSIILDAVVLVLLFATILYGALKGFKHTIINFILFAGSVFLAFTSYVNIIKVYIVDFLSTNIQFSAAMSEEIKLGISMFYTFFASLALAIVFYLILRFFKLLFVLIAKKRREKKGRPPKFPGKISRFLGSVFSLGLNGAVVIILLIFFANPLVGGDVTIQHSRISDAIELNATKAIHAMTGDPLGEEKVMIKAMKGDFLLVDVDDQDAQSLQAIAGFVSHKNLKNIDMQDTQKTLDSLYALLHFMDKYALADSGTEIVGFQHFVKYSRNMISETVNLLNASKPVGELMEGNKTLTICNLLKKVGLTEAATTFEQMFVMQ